MGFLDQFRFLFEQFGWRDALAIALVVAASVGAARTAAPRPAVEPA